MDGNHSHPVDGLTQGECKEQKEKKAKCGTLGPSTLKSLLRKMRLKNWDHVVGRKPEESGAFKDKDISKESGCDHRSQRLQDVW